MHSHIAICLPVPAHKWANVRVRVCARATKPKYARGELSNNIIIARETELKRCYRTINCKKMDERCATNAIFFLASDLREHCRCREADIHIASTYTIIINIIVPNALHKMHKHIPSNFWSYLEAICPLVPRRSFEYFGHLCRSLAYMDFTLEYALLWKKTLFVDSQIWAEWASLRVCVCVCESWTNVRCHNF